jgi:CheY-like chemotaxis protein
MQLAQQKKSILVVEDDNDIRQCLVDLLEDENYIVHSAENGSVGLKVLSSLIELPGLIILDLMMPVLNGYEFRKLQLLDARLSLVPVVLFSANGNLIEMAELPGVSEIVKKPVDIDELYALALRYCH